MMRRSRFTPVLVLAVALAACAENAQPGAMEPAGPVAARLDGEAVFRGLVFGEGAVARAFPEVWNRIQIEDPSWTAEQRAAAATVKSELIAAIHAADPTFFDRFHREMTSRNHVRIARAMDESGALLAAAVQARGGEAPQAIGDATGTCITLAVLGNVVAVVNLAGVANVAVYANAVYNENFFWGAEQPVVQRPADSLSRDRMVHMLASRL